MPPLVLAGYSPLSIAGLAGTTEGKFAVNSNGAATYTVPIQVPPGVNGMQPNLALTYNSQKGNGPLGVGWSLTGLSSISRCKATIGQDGYREGIKFDSERFCLNGKRLIRVGNGADENGQYREYQTKIDSFQRIRAYGADVSNPDKFVLWDRKGTTRVFGGSEDSKHKTLKGILSWRLFQVKDVAQNYFTVNYTNNFEENNLEENNFEEGDSRPHIISYTGNTSQGLSANKQVVFAYEMRTDANSLLNYVDGAKATVQKRLSSITTKFNGDVVKQYKLKYEYESTGSSRSRITDIEECDNISSASSKNCYSNSIVVDWYKNGAIGSYMQNEGPFIPTGIEDNLRDWHQIRDFNGDGLKDIISSGAFIELDAVGRIVNQFATFISVKLQNLDGTYQEETITRDVLTSPTSTFRSLNDDAINPDAFNQWNELADINNDGILDVFRINPRASDENKEILVHLGQANGSVSSNALELGDFTGNLVSFRYSSQLIDMNGDGFLDIFSVDPNDSNSFQVRFGSIDQVNGFEFNSAVTPVNAYLEEYDAQSNEGFRLKNILLDANGDGLIDILHTEYSEESYPEIKISIGKMSVGNQLTYSITNPQDVVSYYGLSAPQSTGYISYTNQFIDVNSDGNIDILSVETNTSSAPEVETPYYGGFVNPASDWDENCVKDDFFNSYDCWMNEYHFNNVKLSNELKVRLGKGDGTFENSYKMSPKAINNTGAELYPDIEVSEEAYSWQYLEINRGSFYKIEKEPGLGLCNLESTHEDFSYSWRGGVKYSIHKRVYKNCEYTSHIINGRGLTQRNNFVDLDSDGSVDIVSLSDEGEVYISYGDGAGQFSDKAPLGINILNSESDDLHGWNEFTDLNGDGLTDILSVSPNANTNIFISNRVKPSKVENITNGLGLITNISYSTLVDPNVYTKNSSEEVDINELQNSYDVVSSFSVINGDDTNTTNYKYWNARVHRLRGWLGFEKTEKIDHRDLIETNVFRQDFPFIGRVYRSEFSSESSPLERLKILEIDWSSRESIYGTVFPYVEETRLSEFEPSEEYALTKLVTTDYQNSTNGTNNYDNTPYDKYGSPEVVVVSNTQDNHELFTSYSNNYVTESLFPGQLSSQLEMVYHAVPIGPSATKSFTRTYDGLGRLESENTLLGSQDAITNTYQYNGYGLVDLLTTTGWDGVFKDDGTKGGGRSLDRVVDYEYESIGERSWTKSETIDGLSKVSTFDGYWGSLDFYQDISGNVTSWEQDSMGRLKSETKYGLTSTTEYLSTCSNISSCLSNTQLVIKTTPAGIDPTETQFDASGRAIRIVSKGVDGSLIYQDTTYDSWGNINKSYVPYFVGGAQHFKEYVYDEYNRLKTVYEPSGTTLTYMYGPSSKQVTRSTTDEPAQVTTYDYDSQGQIVTITQPKAQGSIVTEYTYGPYGVLTKIKDTEGNTFIWSKHDIYGNPRLQTDPNMGTWHYAYNAFGELKWIKDAKSQITSYEYDADSTR